MEQPSTNTTTAPTAHKTFQYKLQPTPAQELALEEVLWRCRVLYNTALEQRLTWWRRGQGHSATRFQQEAELKEIRAAFPEYGAIHSHVVQDVLARLDKPSQAFFWRLANAEKPDFPRFQGRNRSPSFTYQEDGNGARRENGYLVLATIGRSAVRWSRPMEGPSKPVPLSREADGWQVSCAWAQGPGAPLPLPGPETGRDGQRRRAAGVAHHGAAGAVVEPPRPAPRAQKALANAPKRVSRRQTGSKRRRNGGKLRAKKPHHVRRPRQDFPHTTALYRVRSSDTLCSEAIPAEAIMRRL